MSLLLKTHEAQPLAGVPTLSPDGFFSAVVTACSARSRLLALPVVV